MTDEELKEKLYWIKAACEEHGAGAMSDWTLFFLIGSYINGLGKVTQADIDWAFDRVSKIE